MTNGRRSPQLSELRNLSHDNFMLQLSVSEDQMYVSSFAFDYCSVFEEWPALPPPFVTTFHSHMNRTRMVCTTIHRIMSNCIFFSNVYDEVVFFICTPQPLPPSWVSVYGVILPIFCRVALPNQAHWFVDLTNRKQSAINLFNLSGSETIGY